MKKSKQFGFTLMEIMIAMFVFVVIMAIVVSGFSMVVRSNENIREHQDRLSEIQRAVTIITRDLSQIIERSVSDNDGLSIASIVSEYDGHRFEFTRGGYVNPLSRAKRSTLVRVAYEFQNNSIIRTVWPVLDRAPSTEPVSHALLNNVVDFYIYMLDFSNEILPDSGYGPLPKGIVMNIALPNQENITRVIAISRGVDG